MLGVAGASCADDLDQPLKFSLFQPPAGFQQLLNSELEFWGAPGVDPTWMRFEDGDYMIFFLDEGVDTSILPPLALRVMEVSDITTNEFAHFVKISVSEERSIDIIFIMKAALDPGNDLGCRAAVIIAAEVANEGHGDTSQRANLCEVGLPQN